MDGILEEAKAWLYKSRSVRPLESERLVSGLIAEVVRLTNLAENLQSENARLRGLCGLAPKQPVPELHS